MIMRRRPLLRAAAVGGGAYLAGKHRARRQAEYEDAEAEQDARISDLEQQQGAATVSSAPPAAGPPQPASVTDQLRDLANLHAEGVLTDEEFAAAKAKLLGG